jgi:hypothetical protein
MSGYLSILNSINELKRKINNVKLVLKGGQDNEDNRLIYLLGKYVIIAKPYRG